MSIDNSAFYYVDGIPTKGLWVDLDVIDDTDDVLRELADGGFVPKDEDGEPVYGGDLLVADVCGDLPKAFYSSRSDTLDLAGLKDCMSECDTRNVSYEAAAAYIDHFGQWSRDGFDDAYCGEWDSEQAYAEDFFDEHYLHELPDHVQSYIDYEKFARDLFIDGFTFCDGYVFRTN